MTYADKSKLFDQFLEWLLRDAIENHVPDTSPGFDNSVALARLKRVHDLFVRTLDGKPVSIKEWSDEREKSRRVENISYFACVCKLDGYHMGLRLCSDMASFPRPGQEMHPIKIQLWKLFDLICNEPTRHYEITQHSTS